MIVSTVRFQLKPYLSKFGSACSEYGMGLWAERREVGHMRGCKHTNAYFLSLLL